MSKHSNCVSRQAYLFLTLVGLMSGAMVPDYLWSHRDTAQAAISQATSPGWSLSGSINTSRQGHTATLLLNGKVLVAGGFTNCGSGFLHSVELYDPATGTWSYTGSLGSSRSGHSATRLPNGKVLVVAGEGGTDQYLNSAELYDPATGTWSPTGNLNSYLYYSRAVTVLANGKVLAVGQTLRNGRIAELYDPVSGKWSVTGNLNNRQSAGSCQVTLLSDGKVLLLCGTDNTELYDPETGRWSVTAGLKTIHFPLKTIRLPNGKVLVIGKGAQDDERQYAEVYDPASGTWHSIIAPADESCIVLLANGKVLSASGRFAELYDSATGRWNTTTSLNNPALYFSTATLLSNGKVLFSSDNDCDNKRAVLFDFDLAPSGTTSNVSAASYSPLRLASEAITSAFDTGLATTTSAANTFPLPTQLAGTTVKVKDSASVERMAPLFFVSPTQVNYQIPPGTVPGASLVTITSGDGLVSNGVAIIQTVAPGLFTANADGRGVAAALALRIRADGAQSYEPVAQFDPAQNKFIARALDLGPEGEQVYLILFGTGIRQRSSLAAVRSFPRAKEGIASVPLEVTFAGSQGEFTGLDQVNVLVPRSLRGRGEVEVLLLVDEHLSNPVRVNLK